MNFSKQLLTGLAVSLAVSAGAANALTQVDLVGVSGIWTDVDPNPPAISGLNSSTISWGNDLGDGQSGYNFTGAGSSSNIAPDTAFALGDFTHFNNPITGTTLSTAELTVTINLLIGGVAKQVVSVFDFAHWETDNDPGYGHLCANGEAYGTGVNVNGCADRVTAVTNIGSSEVFSVDGVDYVFDFTGFLFDGNDLTEFWTKEQNDNIATLMAQYTLRQNFPGVPLPAAGWLMLAAFGGLGLARRRS